MICRALLLKESLEDICKDKRQRYEAWRKSHLGGPRWGNKFRSFALWTVLPVAAAIYVAKVSEREVLPECGCLGRVCTFPHNDGRVAGW